MTRLAHPARTASLLLVAAVAATACSSSSSSTSPSSSVSTTTASTTTLPRPDGPVPTFAPINGKNAPYVASATTDDLAAKGYVEEEFTADGSATAYESSNGFAGDGRWKFAPTTTAPFRTRVLVRRPKDTAKFSGTVAVEWLNVSSGMDAAPDWSSVGADMVRNGDAWIGVSAQTIGVMGGPVLVSVGIGPAGQGLVKIDPERYGTLEHPGDGYSFDIFTQVGRAARTGALLGSLQPKRVLALGESQSAFALVTYVNGVQPLTRTFDGFFVHSRGAVGLPLAAPGKAAGIADAIAGTPTILRTDQPTPILEAQTESDVSGVLNSFAARQPDSDTFRLWEVAGTAHADRSMLGPVADQIDCKVDVNNGPMRFVAAAAYRHLVEWVETGTAPESAPRFNTTSDTKPEIARDADGIAIGGIRTPVVDAPVEVLSSVTAPNPTTICMLLGSTQPLAPARIAERYASRQAYLEQFTKYTDSVIKAGWILAADRAAVLAMAQPDRVGS